jgi:hypothetical protein
MALVDRCDEIIDLIDRVLREPDPDAPPEAPRPATERR